MLPDTEAQASVIDHNEEDDMDESLKQEEIDNERESEV